MEDRQHERGFCSQACCLGHLCSNCNAGHFLFYLSGDRIRCLYAEHNIIGIADSRCLVFSWMGNPKKENRIAVSVCIMVISQRCWKVLSPIQVFFVSILGSFHSFLRMLYRNRSLHSPLMNVSFRIVPSFLKPFFSSAFCEATFLKSVRAS